MNSIPLLFYLVVQVTRVFSDDYRDVVLEQGPVRGFKIDDENVFSFYGIPYATAPSGEDRFKDALPPPTWTEVLNATDRDIACLQVRDGHGTRVRDCLVVNVFVPDTDETDLPVMAYIHGGGYQYGAGDQMLPTNGLVQHGLVFVNFNYRVGVHGFLCLNTEFAPGNAGAKDQVLALKWVKENIARFGGNPENVAIAGNSAGGALVDLQIVSPMAEDLFIKAITEGGSAFTSTAVTNEPLRIAEEYANQFGVYTNQDVSRLESFYRSLTDEQLNIGHGAAGFLEPGFTPCVETHDLPGIEKFLIEPPIETLQKGNHNKITYMASFTPYEGAIFLSNYEYDSVVMPTNFSQYLPRDIPHETEEELEEIAERVKNTYFPTGEITLMGHIEYFSDINFNHGSYVAARYQALYEDSYMYQFTYAGSLNLVEIIDRFQQYNLTLPAHIAHTLYLYLFYLDVYQNMTPEDYVMEQKLRLFYYNFCKYGNPTPFEEPLLDNVTWLPMTAETPYYLEADYQFTLKTFPQREQFELWDAIYGYDYTRSSGSGATSYLPTFVLCTVCVLMSFVAV